MLTAAVVVDWRRPGPTQAALRSLAAGTVVPDVLVCVENGCTGEEVAQVRAGAPPGTVVVELPENRGFAGGANAGVAEALARGADWVLLLNNDATVEPACLERCLAEAGRHPDVAVVGPAVTFAEPGDHLWFAGGQVSDRFGFTRHPGILRPAGEAPPSSDTAYVSGCCALVRAQAWRDVGPFREDYFAYYEDVEWCMRARQAGWRCRYLGEVLCRHAAGLSSGQRGGNGLTEGTAYYLARNPLRFALETPDPGLRATRVLGILTVWTAYNAWRVARSRDLRVGAAYAAGLGDALRGRMGPRRLTGTRR